MIRRKIIDAVPTALERSVASTFGTPRQVSWLTGHRVLAAFPFDEANSDLIELPARSLFTVARPRGIFTRFPFHSPIEGEHLRRNGREPIKNLLRPSIDLERISERRAGTQSTTVASAR